MVTANTIARAGAGDEQAFRELTDPYRAELGTARSATGWA